ncbi:CARD domain-containing protein [Caenorhabditis elegans]|uniref:CARD domain-containing protein n=1 Tax=Caenorhabditis elegans TaxID=6239 RepID=Q9XTT2_CAEEL|nr:CARD domain-containing protein [Caenorhabditis elegans]CAB11567.1 CARD domain-containing protein [Caenorhabditis elegans]|eukprot:NP_499628.1 Conserved Coiled-Coil Protein [Caenorhabditis elegans]
MEEDVVESCEATPTNSTYGTPVRVASPLIHNEDDVIPTTAVENSLYSKCNAVQEQEFERLESQNAEYREKLLRTIRERDLNEELLKNVQNQHKKELDAQVRRIRELEVQLKTTTDRGLAQEAHFNVTTKEMSQKFNLALQQATKKAEQCDKEKNEAVVKYAMREGEMMKLRDEISKKDSNMKVIKEELEAARKAQSQENLDDLEKTVQNLKVEIEKLKHERFDFENRMKIAEKRVESLSSNLSESKQQGDMLRKQLIQAKDDKHIIQQYEVKLQTSTAELERRLRESEHDVERLRTSQLEMATKFEEASRENTDLLSKIDILQDQLSLEEDRRKLCEEQIDRLKGVESFVESSSHRIEETEKERETAEEDREQAELEAAEYREQVEKMLKLTQELTERNMELQRKLKDEEGKNTSHNSTIEKLQVELTTSLELCKSFEETNLKISEELENLKTEMQKPVTLESLEENFYRDKYDEASRKLEQTEAKLAEEKNNFSAFKKKTSATLKELKSELSGYRKNNGAGDSGAALGAHVLAPPTSSDPSMSSRSRASSITSIDRVTSTSREEEVSSAAGEEAKRIENEEQKLNMQQIMIDKIVILQRKLARRTEKCEFLEEHVRQCLEELQKKTKIIQHFALREEASLLMPSEGSLEKVPIGRKSAAYALMGAMFTSSGNEKKQVQIMTEVNSRLQAVLEDVIQKNILMRSSVDTLSADNTRLSRENRLLSLSQVRTTQDN